MVALECNKLCNMEWMGCAHEINFREINSHVINSYRAFMLLKDAALVLGLTFDPLVIVSDFELDMVQASTMSFPNSYHRGCYYHFKQAIWRKVYAC